VAGAPLVQAEWLPDNRTVVLGSAEGTVSLFDAERGTLRAPPLPGADGRAADVYVMPGVPDELVALSGEFTGRRWPLDPMVWVRHACAVVHRDLTRTEWEQYLPDRPYRRTCSDLG
jgi:hypothetical protein